MPFDVTLEKAQAAFEFCYKKFITTEPPNNLQDGRRGTWETDEDGCGNWCGVGTSAYFHCGVTDPDLELEEGEIPEKPRKGCLKKADMDKFVKWFNEKKLNKAAVLTKGGYKYNFTAVVNGRAFNFHLVLG